MKKRIYIIFFSLLMVASSCDDFLDEELQGTYSSESFYRTDGHAVLAINGAYNNLLFRRTANSLWVFGDVASDDAVKGGNPGDQADIQFINDFNILPDNGFIENFWKHYYETIARANYILYYLPGNEITPALKSRVMAEARFIRAYSYFHLVNIYGDIPLKKLPPINFDAIHVPVSTVDEVMDFIEEELILAAEDLLPSYTGANQGRATKGSAYGLLAKTRLFREDWPGVLQAIENLESVGAYALTPNFSYNFRQDFQNNEESVFEIQHLTEQDPILGSFLNQWFSPQVENGFFFNNPTESLVSEFEQTAEGVVDPRLDYTLAREGGQWLNGENFDPAWSTTGYLVKKHSQPIAEIPRGRKGDADLNYVFMRYAEVLLMKAEALNETGMAALAREALNQVRSRARESYLVDENLDGFGTLPEGLLPNVTSNDQNELREAIRHERRVELAMEFHRFFDLMRYGSSVAEAALSDTFFNYEEHRYFPIPQSERDINQRIN